jgi:hypothetical protein
MLQSLFDGFEAADGFTDVRQIATRLIEAGVEISTEELHGESGPGHIALVDPDGNQILIDQHR